jgi:hypothetical protein
MAREIFSQLAGIIMLLGSMILIYIRRLDLTKPISRAHPGKEALWVKIGNHISLKTGTPALALFALGFLLVVLPLIFHQSKEEEAEYQVVGTVNVLDTNGIRLNRLPDVDLYLSDPPAYKIGKAGNIPDIVKVTRGVHGFPMLHLEGTQVAPKIVDLNVDSIATINKNIHVIRIKDNITLFMDP